MTNIITNSSAQEEAKQIKPVNLEYSLVRLKYTSQLSSELKNRKVNFSLPTLYDVFPLLYLVYKSLKIQKVKLTKTTAFLIDCKEYANRLYRGENNADCLKNFYKLLKLINLIGIALNDPTKKQQKTGAETANKQQLIKFELKKARKCRMEVTNEFYKYIEQETKNKSGYCLRIYPECRAYLGLIRKSQRAYAIFLEELFGLCQAEFNKNTEEEILSKKKRIKELFSYEGAKHICGYKEVISAAKKQFNNLNITGEVFFKLRNVILEKKTKSGDGSSPRERYENGQIAIKMVNEAKSQGKRNDELEQLILSCDISNKLQTNLLNNNTYRELQ